MKNKIVDEVLIKDEIQALLQPQSQEDSGKMVVTNQFGESGPPAKQGTDREKDVIWISILTPKEKIELDRYLQTPQFYTDNCPLEWWKDNQQMFPV